MNSWKEKMLGTRSKRLHDFEQRVHGVYDGSFKLVDWVFRRNREVAAMVEAK